MMKHKHIGAALFAGTLALTSSAMPLQAVADWQHIGCMGDLNRDREVSLTDLVTMTRYLHGQGSIGNENFYPTAGAYIGVNGGDGYLPGDFLNTADINQDGAVDVFDLALLKRYVIAGDGPWVWQYFEDASEPTETDEPTEPSETDAPTEPTETDVPTEPTEPTEPGDFIEAPINAVKGYLPPQGEAKLVILYVDFPDCQYTYEPTADEIDKIAFGSENPSDSNYPFESASAFYNRASKGAMQLSGKAFRYTAQKNVAEYDDVAGRQALVKEALKALEEQTDFTAYDGDHDGFIDTTLLSVPKAAGDDNWWPCAGPVDDNSFFVDGEMIGHIITSNAQIDAKDNYYNFNSTILHEMGHCMGLPDYYLYHGNDTEGMHGTAGSELMDDATSDFSCVSKLQLGWYRQNQIEVFDASQTSATYTLHNAQTDAGNTVLIPCGDLNSRYQSEYMLIEYTTQDANNSHPEWWVKMDSGIRVYHVDATVQSDYWGASYLYGSGAPATNNDEGRRLLRIIDDRDVDNLYRTGDVIDGNISGFHWYDASGYQTVDTGITITVGELTADGYQITVTRNS